VLLENAIATLVYFEGLVCGRENTLLNDKLCHEPG
jgi:hypothetical protein